MYIPVMAFVTYILLSTLLAGLRGAFHPEVMGLTATAAFAVVAVEILGLKFGTYVLSISNESQLLDLVAYSGYKFVGVIVTLVVGEVINGGAGTGGWGGWGVFLYCFFANAFFLVSPPLSLGWNRDRDRRTADGARIAAIPEIRPPPRRLLLDARGGHADGRALAAESADAVPFPVFLCRAIHLHVGALEAGWQPEWCCCGGEVTDSSVRVRVRACTIETLRPSGMNREYGI